MGNLAHLISNLDEEYIYIISIHYLYLYNCLFPGKKMEGKLLYILT